MTEFFGRIRSGADKARFEAERMIRINQAQSALKDLERQLQAATAAMGTQALALYDAGTLQQPELVATCQQIGTIRQRISTQKAEIERIRQEQPPGVAAAALYGHICPQCQIQLPAEAGFCQRCGSRAVDIAPPPVEASVICPSCGAPVPAGAHFCPNDGTPIKPAAVSAPPATTVCPACQTSVLAEAVFCPHCGASLSALPGAELPPSKPVADGRAPESIYCPNCGSSIPGEAEFCPECGHRVTTMPFPLEAPAEVEDAAVSMKCPKCGWSIPAEAVFCPECGTPIAKGEVADARNVCPVCQASIPVEAVFCPECGASITPTPPEPATVEQIQPEVESSRDEPVGQETVSDEDGGSSEDQTRPLSEAAEIEDLPEEGEMEDLPEEEETTLHTVCPFCQALVPAEAEFCPECGEPIPSGPAKPK